MNSARIRIAASAAMLVITAGTTLAREMSFATTPDNTLISWDSASPGNILSGVPLSGLQSNEQIRGIDFRPATGQLYALGSFSNLYTVNIATGQLSLVGAGSFAPGLNGAAFGFDFNPVIDRIRVVSDANQNLVLNPISGDASAATSLFYGPGDPNFGVDPNVVSSAYTNSFFGASTTQLYGIDTGLDILVTQANSAGTLGTVGPLGVNMTSIGGFDISSETGIAYMAGQDANLGHSSLWSVNLSTGAATFLGQIGGGLIVTSFAILTAPAPGTLAMLGLAFPFSVRRRRQS